MLSALLQPLAMGGALLSLVYYALAIYSARQFFHRRMRSDVDFTPAVSILKPVRGLDAEAYQDFASFCHQAYPDYEILFAVAEAEDPVVPIIKKVIDDNPNVRIRLLMGSPELGPSSKVNKLCRLVREASHDVLVMNDSDIRVSPDYLRAVVAPLQDETVGAVTCLYRGLPNGRLAGDLEALGIATDFAAGVLVARQLEGVKFALGATIVVTRERLAQIGGFEALVDYCAEDFELGHRIAARGYRVELASYIVDSECAGETLASYFRHQFRWCVSTRHSRPWGHFGLVLTHGLPWSIAAAAVAPSLTMAMAFPCAYLALRWAVAWSVGIAGLGDGVVRRKWWLVPVRDAVAFAVWTASLFSNRIDWRGRQFELRSGRLVSSRVDPS